MAENTAMTRTKIGRLTKKQRGILAAHIDGLRMARARNANETDTRQYIERILTDALGYTVEEVECEHFINGKPCDIALWFGGPRKGGRPVALIECKRVSRSLKSNDVTSQMKVYAFEAGVKWAMLTNGLQWDVYAVEPRSGCQHPVLSLNLDGELSNDTEDGLCAISREGMKHGALKAIKAKRDIFNPFVCAQILLDNSVLRTICGILSKAGAGHIDKEDVAEMLSGQVIRDKLLDEGCTKERVKQARKIVAALSEPKVPPVHTTQSGGCVPIATADRSIKFHIKHRGVEANGRIEYGNDGKRRGFLVFCGCRVVEPVASFENCANNAFRLRAEMEKSGLIKDGVLQSDYVFSSASMAASVLCGDNTRPSHWTTEDGRNYSAIIAG